MDIKTIGVVGCGQMGSGIAEVSARAGYNVLAREVNEEFLNKGLKAIQGSLDRGVQKGKVTQEERDAILGRVKGTTRLEDLGICDFIIEAIIENMPDKKATFSALDKACPPHTILASNTSALSLTEMACSTKRPDRFIGMHFFNPPTGTRLLEVGRTILSSDETVEVGRKIGESMGRTVVVVPDAPGFIVNRLLVPYLLDAIRCYEAGVATKEDLDSSITLGLNHPMGPLALSDFIGLDTIYFIAETMFADFKEPRFAPPPLLKKMVTAGLFGRKAGKGFYTYGK
ncbi:MAG: 3-hydroxybutyryl-CoA dehydrogenase [Dehalococcoidia bacterium]|nr:3-hydroxybutyryl-CoA dehydrogenase [Dehalococcoidia bacterium]